MNKLLLNFSQREKGKTYDMVKSVKEEQDTVIFIPDGLSACNGCRGCKAFGSCTTSENEIVNVLIHQMNKADHIAFFSPVYLNNYSPKLSTFLSICSSISENLYERNLFFGKEASIYLVGDVSGTQAAANSLLGALNMLGFTIPGRSVYTYVRNWKDNKIRGGILGKEKFIPIDNFKTYSEM